MVRRARLMATRRASIRAPLAAASVAVLVVAPATATLGLPVNGDDVPLLLYPLKMSEGLVIHRDFFSPYGPGGYRVLEAAFSMLGPSPTVEHLVGVGYHLAIALGVFALARPLGLRASLAAGLACAAIFLWFSPVAFAWFGGLALAIGSLALLANSRRSSIAVVAGVLAGLVPWWRPEMAALWLSAVPLCLATRRSGAYVLGLALGLIPLVAHLSVAGSAVFDNVVRSRLTVNGQYSLATIDAKVWALVAACAVGIAVQLWFAAVHREHRPLLLSAAALSLLTLPQALQRLDIYHVTYAACFVLPMSAATIAGALSPESVQRVLTPMRVATAAIAAGAALAIGSVSIAQIPWPTLGSEGRVLRVTPQKHDRLAAVMASVREHVPPSSRVFIGSQDMSLPTFTDNELYYLLPEYQSPFFYLELAPGASERKGSRLPSDLSRADALVLREAPPGFAASEYPNVTAGAPDANQVVADTFCVAAVVGTTRIYVRKPCAP